MERSWVDFGRCWDTQRASWSHREPERATGKNREPQRATESHREPQRATQSFLKKRRFPFHVESGLCWGWFCEPKRLQDASKTTQDAPRRPKTPQDAAKTAQDAPKTPPRGLQERPRRPQEASKSAKDAPRRPQEGHKSDFWWNFDEFLTDFLIKNRC